MSSEFSRRRSRNRLQLKVRAADPAVDAGAEPDRPRPVLPAWVTALLAGVGAGAAGWLLVSLPIALSWLMDRTGEVGPVLGTATQIWLLAHGGGLRIGDVQWTLTPLAITILLVLLVAQVTTVVLRRGEASVPSGTKRWRLPAFVAGAYTLVVVTTALSLGSPVQVARTAAGAVLVAGVGALWGASRVVDLGLLQLLPGWARAALAAAAASVGTVLIGGAAALAVSILLHRERITAIADGLGVDGLTSVQLVLAQLVFWPNLLVWAACWVLGSGFTVGDGTVVSPPATDLGLLPSIPVFGALPAEGAGQWALGWLMVGLAAGALAGLVVLRRRPSAGLNETAGASFVAGIAALAVLTLLALLSGGDLGVARLAGLGPRIVELMMLGGALLILPATTAGVIGGIVRHWRGQRRQLPESIATDTEAEEPTRVVGVVDDREPSVRVGDRVDP